MANEINNQSEVSAQVELALIEQKKKKKRKKLIIIAVVIVVIIAIAALSSGGSDDDASKEKDGGSVSVSQQEEPKGTIGKYVCTVKSAKLCKNWAGKDSVKITYSFTNNSSDAKSFDLALDDNVYQDGIGLESTWISDDDEDDFGIDVKVKPGVTKDVCKVYVLNNKESDLEVEIGELFSFDDTKVVTTVSISK